MSSKKFGGIALFGAAALGGLYLLSKNSERDVTDLSGLAGGPALGTGGSTALVPGTESATTPYTSAEDSIAKGIEDAPDGSLMGDTEISESGVSNMPASQIDAMQFDTVSVLGSAGVAVGAGAAGSLAGRLAGGSLLGRVLSKGLGAVGLALFAGDAYDVNKALTGSEGRGLYHLTALPELVVNPAGTIAAYATTGSTPLMSVAGQFGQAMSGLNVAIGDTIAETVLGGSKPAETITPTPSQEGYGSTTEALNAISGSDSGTTWEMSYSATKTGASPSRGITTNTYQASTGAQVALAGISAEDYTAYLAEKRK